MPAGANERFVPETGSERDIKIPGEQASRDDMANRSASERETG